MILRLLLFFVFSLKTINTSKNSDANDCFNVKDYYWKHLGTKTPYRYVANTNDTKITYDGCEPKKIWMVIRHGTRYPSSKLINRIRTRLPELRDAINDNYKNKKSTLCEFRVSNITHWTPQIDLEDEKKLSHEGEDEMVELAERFQNRFPSVIGKDYSNSSFNFRFTDTQRTKQSNHYFAVGLFGRKIAHHIWTSDPVYKDPILRFYKLCSKWRKEVHKNPKASVEYDAFKSSAAAKKLIKTVSRRLGFEKHLKFDDLELMYMTCSYESAWNKVAPSPWCAVFSQKDMQAMEFSRDLKHYWADGYGYDINFRQACPMMEDMFKHLKSEDGPKSTFYFAHSGTILKLLSHLGLYYDETKLTHDKLNNPRLWRVSYIDSFGSNLAFVTFQCGDKLKLLTLHQERPVKLPGCPKEGLCVFDKVMKTYKESFRNCRFSEICENE